MVPRRLLSEPAIVASQPADFDFLTSVQAQGQPTHLIPRMPLCPTPALLNPSSPHFISDICAPALADPAPSPSQTDLRERADLPCMSGRQGGIRVWILLEQSEE
jgi:hypothetical protein